MLSTVCDNSQYQFLKCPTQILKWTASKKWKVPVFSLKQACQVRTGNEEENLQSILRVRMSLVLSRKTWISILTVHCWFYYHSWCFDWLWQYNELYFSWLSIYLNNFFFLLLSGVLSIAFRVYLFVGINSKSSFINFVFVSKKVSNTAHSLYSKYIWRLVSTVYCYLWAAKKNPSMQL